jgi:CubicO group peptidase (beta-lactamase class C family)
MSMRHTMNWQTMLQGVRRTAEAAVASDDCFTFARVLLRKGHIGNSQERLIPASLLTQMTRNQLTRGQRQSAPTLQAAGLGWGYGVGVVVAATPEGMPPAAYGWNGGRGTSLWVDPARELTVVIMTQRMFESADPPTFHKQVWRSVFGACLR